MVALSLKNVAALAAVALLSVVTPTVGAQSLPNLRILSLGDSITKGNGASDGNGYRNRLRGKIVTYGAGSGTKVDMVGSLRSGTMRDNDHEGHSGQYLAEIRDYLQLSVKTRPNVVLIHAGTNNMDKNVDVDIADDLMEGIIDDVFQASPKALILLAPVIWANDPAMQARTSAFNKKLEAIVRRRQGEGQHILPVPMNIKADDLSDKKHPNDAGYRKMADAWFDAVLEADGRGWISPPAQIDYDKLPCMGLGYRVPCEK